MAGNKERKTIKLKVFKPENRKQLFFQLYVLETNIPKNTNDSETTNDDPWAYTNLELTGASRFLLPVQDQNNNALDPNLDPKKWEAASKMNHPATIEELELQRGGNKISFNFLTDKAQTLFHSLLYAKFHVNPLLQYNIDTETWSFIENTESLDQQLR